MILEKYLNILFFILLLIATNVAATEYYYDDLHRLTRVERDDGTVTVYEYDSFGNRTNKTVTAGSSAPQALLTANRTSGSAPLQVAFSDQSTGTITSWAWDFNNDGTTDATDQHSTHTYTAAGIYSVKLTVNGPNGSDSQTRTSYITVAGSVAPVANFTANPTFGTVPLTVSFRDQSAGTITSWAWDFNNDGVVDATGQDPTYTYATSGTFDVRLTVTGPGGSDTMTRSQHIVAGDDPCGSILATAPLSRAVSASNGSTTFSVANLGIGSLNWTAQANNSWLTVTSGGAGLNDGTFAVSYAENTGSARTGTVTVTALGAYESPQKVEINQASTSGPGVSVTAPVTGEVWTLGSTQTIRWNASSPQGINEIRLFYHYGGNSYRFATLNSNAGTYTWTVPSSSAYMSANARIRVVAIDGSGSSSEAFSPYFTVQDSAAPPAPWPGPMRLTTTPDLGLYTSQDNSYAALAVDSAGVVHLVYRYAKDEYTPETPRSLTQKLYYRQKVNGTWLAPTEIFSQTNVSPDNNGPGYEFADFRIAVDSQNRPQIAWVAYGPFTDPGCMEPNGTEIYSMFFNGTTWSAPTNVSTNSTVSGFVDIAFDPADNLHFVWRDGTSRNSACVVSGTSALYHRVRKADGSWSITSPVISATSRGYYPALAKGRQSGVHLVFTSEDGLEYTKWDGSSWSNPNLLSSEGDDYYHKDLHEGDDGTVHVVYAEWHDAGPLLSINYLTGSELGWSAPETVSESVNGYYKMPEISLDSENVPQIVWYEHGSQLDRILYRQKTGGTWSSAVQLNTLASKPIDNDKNSVSIDLSIDDTLHAVWHSTIDGDDEIYYTFAEIDNDQAVPELQVTAPETGSVLVANTVYPIRWTAVDNTGVQSVNLKYSTDGGITFTTIAVIPGNPGSYAWTMPTISSTAVQVSVTVTDLAGNATSANSGVFSIVDAPSSIQAGFSANATKVAIDIPVTFSDQSTGDVESWLWVFGDGSISTEQNPTYIYQSPGDYTVSLTVSGGGMSDTLTQSSYLLVTAYPSNYGDIDGNGLLELSDAIIALQIMSGKSDLSASLNADVDKDGKISLSEAIFIIQQLSTEINQ